MRAVLRRRAAESPSARGLRRPLAVLIENVNDDGFLEWSEPMREELERQFGGEPTEAAVFALQTLSPPGVGARDLSECLLLQIKSRRLALLNNSADSDSKPGANSDSELEEKLAVLAAAEKIAAERLRWFLRRRMDKLPKRRLAAAAEVLESLSFRPGAAAGDAEAESAATALTDVEFLLAARIVAGATGDGGLDSGGGAASGGRLSAGRGRLWRRWRREGGIC